MKKSIFVLIGFLLLTTAASALSLIMARADMKNAKGEVIGTAVFMQMPDSVTIDLTISGLTPGKHGIHIHEFGKCDAPDFKTAGGHFNPTGKHHGVNNPKGGPHAGDLPNLVVGADGKVDVRLVAKGVSLIPGPNSLLKPGGTSLVIHAGPDDEMSDPAGNSGARVACGVIVA